MGSRNVQGMLSDAAAELLHQSAVEMASEMANDIVVEALAEIGKHAGDAFAVGAGIAGVATVATAQFSKALRVDVTTDAGGEWCGVVFEEIAHEIAETLVRIAKKHGVPNPEIRKVRA